MMLCALYKAKFNKSIIWNKLLLYIYKYLICLRHKAHFFHVFQFFISIVEWFNFENELKDKMSMEK